MIQAGCQLWVDGPGDVKHRPGIDGGSLAQHLASRIITCNNALMYGDKSMTGEEASAVRAECFSLARVFHLMPQLRVEISRQRKVCEAC